MIRDILSVRCELTVCDALIDYGVRGSNDRLAAAIDALHELGFTSSAHALEAVLESRAAMSETFSVRA